jgi:hypothetical protein
MKRVKFLRNGFSILLLTAFMAAVTIFSWGTGVTYAGQKKAVAPPPTAEQQAAAKKRADADAAKVRAQRDARIKNRHEAQKAIQKIVEGEKPAAAGPGNAGKESAK